ncbi:hypothetical protein [Streptomyces sp. NRRL B-1347]|uniref:hypothetical protein n=1 Tax=Streptomyces sp. NRRL B-1347 TaxID=1476877 RepID=UPI0004CA58A6|nr:hypothetical protein [Streptomyces sp. NRRL B-1347]
MLAELFTQPPEWNVAAEPSEELARLPCDQAALAGGVEADVVDAELVVVVEEQVSGEWVELVAAQAAGVFGGFAVQ